MKTEFKLDVSGYGRIGKTKGVVKIIGHAPKHLPYVSIDINDETAYIKEGDLERFAVNILKALKSKKLK